MNKLSIVFLIILFIFLTAVNYGYSEVKYLGDQYRDPLKSVLPQSPKKRPSLELNVQGIIWGSDTPSAIINGEVMNVGDTIQGAKIVKINKKGIVVSVGEESFLFKTGRQKKGGK